jgi:hypothetical protein
MRKLSKITTIILCMLSLQFNALAQQQVSKPKKRLFKKLIPVRKCVGEGRNIVVHPDAPKKCCPGLELERAPVGIMGSAGKCVKKKVNKCVGEGRGIVVHPDAPQNCCPGLYLQPAAVGIMGSRGICVKEKNLCVAEGRSIPVVPNAPSCCKGLELIPPPKGIMGSKGKCVQKKKTCVGEGKKISLKMRAVDGIGCCEGLAVVPPKDKHDFSHAKCLPVKCVEEEGKITHYMKFKGIRCCKGLRSHFPSKKEGAAGKCVPKVSCAEKGGSIPVILNPPKCCKGLVLIPPERGIMGSAGTCEVDKKAIVDSDIKHEFGEDEDSSSGKAGHSAPSKSRER